MTPALLLPPLLLLLLDPLLLLLLVQLQAPTSTSCYLPG
jgi:hypothetical protein